MNFPFLTIITFVPMVAGVILFLMPQATPFSMPMGIRLSTMKAIRF